ncbi:helix-turn-helix transcriptional regulator [Halalkalicoccus subterraneus]|uniref:helix-turn-helix transcriptional regulator n=1 Tax=Halalkalicoccus subterraneus TaxID=2675002 RepID=UPI0034A3D085
MDTSSSRYGIGVGFGPGAVALQSTPGIDCMMALIVGLLGGMLAGMAISRARVSEPDNPSGKVPWTPPMAADDTETTTADRTYDGDRALTDEERVVQLLSAHEGRMKQSRIVDETDWSKAKVSRLLSAMAERDEITKLTIGRENIIFLGTVDEGYVSGEGSKR